jgi:hypothetical protein
MKNQTKYINGKYNINQLKRILDAFEKKEKCITLKFAQGDFDQNEDIEEDKLKIELIPTDITKAAKALKNDKGIVINFIPSFQEESFLALSKTKYEAIKKIEEDKKNEMKEEKKKKKEEKKDKKDINEDEENKKENKVIFIENNNKPTKSVKEKIVKFENTEY